MINNVISLISKISKEIEERIPLSYLFEYIDQFEFDTKS